MVLQDLKASMEKHFKIYFFLILAIAVFNIFYHLGGGKIYDWDEARHGASAYEMIKNNNFIKITYMGSTDYYNTKPILGFWAIAASYKLFGYHVFSLRFPNALAALLCIGLTMLFAKKQYNNRVAIFSGLILITMYDFIFKHSGRSGDFDAQLALLVLICVICFSKIKINIKYFYFSAIVISIAFLLKSFAVFQIFFILGFLLITTDLKKQLKLKHYAIFVAIFMAPILLWMIARFHQDGMRFFTQMLGNDISHRVFSVNDAHEGNIFYHIAGLSHRIFPWSLFFYAFFFYKSKFTIDRGKRIPFTFKTNEFYNNKLMVCWLFVPLITFSLVKTKLGWYINPIYPAVAIMLAWYFDTLIRTANPQKSKVFKITFLVLFLLAEVRIIGGIYQDGILDPGQKYLLSLHVKASPQSIKTYRMGQWLQSEVFILEVLKGQTLSDANIKSIDDFIKIAKPEDRILVENTHQSNLLKPNLSIIGQNAKWILFQKQ